MAIWDTLREIFLPGDRRLPKDTEALFRETDDLSGLRVDKEHGASGHESYGGLLQQDDYNPLMIGEELFRTIDKMRKADGSVQAALAVMKLPILRTRVKIGLADENNKDPKDIEIADKANEVILKADYRSEGWSAILRNMLLMLDFGFSVDEKIWSYDRSVGLIAPARIAPRLPRTIKGFKTNPDGTLDTVIQQALKAGAVKELKIPCYLYGSVYTWNKEGENHWGMSVLRPMYKHWFYKEELYRIDAVRHDRWATGIPRAKIKSGYRMNDNEKSSLRKMLQALRGTERAFAMHPEEVEIDLLTPQGSLDGESLMMSVNHHDTMMFRSILAHFITVGNQEHGNYGSANSFVDMFLYAEQAIALYLEEQFTYQVIRPFCEINFDMTNRPYPRLKFANIEYIDMKAVTEALARMASAKLVEPDNDLEEDIRRLFGWPKKGTPRLQADGGQEDDAKNTRGRPPSSDAGKNARVNQGDRQNPD